MALTRGRRLLSTAWQCTSREPTHRIAAARSGFLDVGVEEIEMKARRWE